jgi:hypothetical protein
MNLHRFSRSEFRCILQDAFLVVLFGSSGIAVGANQGLPHQDSTNEFPLFFGRINHETTLAHGFLML